MGSDDLQKTAGRPQDGLSAAMPDQADHHSAIARLRALRRNVERLDAENMRCDRALRDQDQRIALSQTRQSALRSTEDSFAQMAMLLNVLHQSERHAPMRLQIAGAFCQASGLTVARLAWVS